ncbi:phosphoglycerate mutase-like protein [Parathielavia hyrcaniae]|uniref:Phosphoglycerate mutase-like protein n=1 Tax=Parathielavia hyrcaniae TaxID=113614 RepID=A0AAN6Q2S2_9PEZI|nr:phosphoglycerate mutase-like protein [Parathielavia hyrcaniae]
MRLFLVRHGETVDNVSGIYAGSRDSPLTAHGVLQAHRLAAHLAARSATIGPVTHVFSSDLKRAVETAQAVVDAQPQPTVTVTGKTVTGEDVVDGDAAPLKVVKLRELRERDFGSAEGKKFSPGVVGADAESRDQMRLRAERFLREWLVPLFTAKRVAAGGCVVVVAHGLILESLLRVLLADFGPAALTQPGSPRLVGWSNTGYVELVVRVDSPGTPATAGGLGEVSGERTPVPAPSPTSLAQQPRITLSVVAANVLKHLEGLKKTRGGIGSAQFDKRQRTVDSFFGPAAKKAKVGRGLEEVEATLHPSAYAGADGCGTAWYVCFPFPPPPALLL